MKSASDFNLDAMVRAWAVEIFEQTESLDDGLDLAHQYADGSEWVIYYGKAHQLCAHCNTDLGEQFLEMCGQPEGGWTYDGLASAIAFGEIYERLLIAVSDIYEIAEAVA